MNNKRIVFFASTLWGGGAERVAVRLASYFVQHNVAFAFYVFKDSRCAYELPEGVLLNTDYVDPTMSFMDKLRAMRSVMKSDRDAIYMSFLVHDSMTMLLASIGLKVRTVISCRNLPASDFSKKRFGYILRFLRDRLYRCASMIVFQTEEQRRLMGFNDSQRSVVIPNPLPDALNEVKVSKRSKRIVSVGRLESQKNVPMTIEGFAQFVKTHPDYSLDIYGEGSLKQSLVKQINSLDLQESVRLCGFTSNIQNSICDAAVFVMTSDFEGMPNALMEALALGIPCIATDSKGGGAAALIDSGVNGVLIERGDTRALSAALVEIADNRQFADTLSRNAQESCKRFSIDTIGAKWLEVLN